MGKPGEVSQTPDLPGAVHAIAKNTHSDVGLTSQSQRTTPQKEQLTGPGPQDMTRGTTSSLDPNSVALAADGSTYVWEVGRLGAECSWMGAISRPQGPAPLRCGHVFLQLPSPIPATVGNASLLRPFSSLGTGTLGFHSCLSTYANGGQFCGRE